LPWEAWTTLAVLAMGTVAMARNWAGPDVVLVGSLVILCTIGAAAGSGRVPTAAEAFSHLGNEGLLTIAALFVVAAGLTRTGAMRMVLMPLLGKPDSSLAAQARLLPPVMVLSAFMNNTPIVAMMIPVVVDWSRRIGLAGSRLLMPLSFAAILGGMCTLIGTSTNLAVYGLLDPATQEALGLFGLAWVGLPVAAAGLIYLMLAGRLLPKREDPVQSLEDAKQYTVEMLVVDGGAMDGKTIEKAGLRSLPGLYLMEVQRGDEALMAVGPEHVLHGGDRLIFVGDVSAVVELRKMRGLTVATDQVFKLSDAGRRRHLVEAVVSQQCPLIGKTVREGRFRTTYEAAIISVHRGGRHLEQKVGDIVLRPGDTLLLETQPGFVDRQRNRRDFYLVSAVDDSQPLRHDRAAVALAALALMVILAATGALSLLNAALVAAGLMVLLRCCTATDARASVDWRVLIVIGAALGLGDAMNQSGLADVIAHDLIVAAGAMGTYGILAGIFITASVLSLFITNVGAAVLVFPIIGAAATELQCDPLPLAVTLMIGASTSFATPIGYQTNLMVLGPGGYRFNDYLRLGLPLTVVTLIVTVLVTPIVFPL